MNILTKIIFTIIAVLGIFTKGFWIIYLLPYTIIVIPLLFRAVDSLMSSPIPAANKYKKLRFIAYGLFLYIYVLMPGVGDTYGILVAYNIDNDLGRLLTNIGIASMFALFALIIAILKKFD